MIDWLTRRLPRRSWLVDYTRDLRFRAMQEATDVIIRVMAGGGIRDARAIADRAAGWHNLQGHARAIVPLALWLVLNRPDLLCVIREQTDLQVGMSGSSNESRREFWDEVQEALIPLLDQRGEDRIVEGIQANSPETAHEIANTYLSRDYGGGQSSGGGGSTVLKRTLKLLSHTLPRSC